MEINPYPNKSLAAAALAGHEQSSIEPPTRLLHTLAEAADLLRCSYTTVWRLTRRGDLGVVRIGAKVLVPQSEIDAYIARALAREAG